MVQVGVNMPSFFLARKNWAFVTVSLTIPTHSLIWNPPLNDLPAYAISLLTREAKQKDQGKHYDQRQGSVQPSGHEGSKKMKQQALEFSSAHPLSNILILTNIDFFTNDFVSIHMVEPTHISKQGCHVLNRSDDAANWTNFWVFMHEWWPSLNTFKVLQGLRS